MTDRQQRALMEMLQAIQWEIRAATYAVRGVPKWDHQETQRRVLRALDEANRHAENAVDAVPELGPWRGG